MMEVNNRGKGEYEDGERNAILSHSSPLNHALI